MELAWIAGDDKSSRCCYCWSGRIPRVFHQFRVIHPASDFRAAWEVLIMVLCLYVALVLPFQMAFVYLNEERVELGLRERGNTLNADDIIGIIIDVVFWADLVLNFFTGQASPNMDVIVLDHTVVVWRYMRSWFVIDLVSVLPFDAIIAAALDTPDSFDVVRRAPRIVRLLRILRLVKLLRIERLFRYGTRQLGYSGRIDSTRALLLDGTWIGARVDRT